MSERDPVWLARVYVASDTGHQLWQSLDTAMVSIRWDQAFAEAYRERFQQQPPPGTSLGDFAQRLDYNEATYRRLYAAVHDAALNQMIDHHVKIAEDSVDYDAALEPAAAAALETAFHGISTGGQ